MTAIDFAASDLMDLVKTKTDVEEFLWHCDNMLKRMYEKNGSIAEYLQTQFPYGQERIVLTLMKKQRIPVENGPQALEFFTSLKHTLTILPVISFTVAFYLTASDIEILAAWFLREYKHAVLFNIMFEPNIIGGAVISANGRVTDYSIRKYLSGQIQKKNS